MLTVNNIRSIYTGHIDQASQERQRRAANTTADIIGDVAAAAARGQRIYFINENDIQRDILWIVKDQLVTAGFKVKTRLRNGVNRISIEF